MHNIKLVIAYVGEPFLGWQKTETGKSVEAVLQEALERILQHKVELQAASRTDAGVHAEGQVVHFLTEKPLDLRRISFSLNGLLPKEISVIDIKEMASDFHPTLQSVKKEYWYHICHAFFQLPFYRHTSWHFPYPLDLKQMQRASKYLLGTHDFSAFCNARSLWDRTPVCHVESIEICSLDNCRLKIAISADHFLYKMARNLVGTLAYVGSGKLDADQIPWILESKDRTQGGITAPAHGLLLKEVFYYV